MRNSRLPQQHASKVSLATLVLLAAIAGCSGPGASPEVATPSASPVLTVRASTTVAFDCLALVAKAPKDAAAALRSASFQVSWRFVHTITDGTAVADVVTQPPAGRIVDIILDGVVATVFVADPEDPAALSPEPPTC